MIRKRSIFLFVVLIFLVGLTLVLTRIEEQINVTTIEDDSIFAIDNISEVDRVVMEGGGVRNELVNDNGIWRIQNRYPADPDMTKVLLRALNEVRIKRPVPDRLSERVAEALEKNGVHVRVYKGDHLVNSFLAGGDMEKKESYFTGSEDGKPMIVFIPGYNGYLSGVFELNEIDWRNRVIFNSNWTSLQNLKVTYPDDSSSNFEIVYNNNFFQIPEIDHLDTVKVMAYIELFNYIEAENYISGEKYPVLDSILNLAPIVKIDLQDMNAKKNNSLQLYRPINQDETMLGLVGDKNLAVIKYPKVQNLIKKRRDFQKN